MLKEEFFAVAFRKTLYESLDQLEADLGRYLEFCNRERAHQGYRTQGRTPYQAFLDGLGLAGYKPAALPVVLHQPIVLFASAKQSGPGDRISTCDLGVRTALLFALSYARLIWKARRESNPNFGVRSAAS